jgi:glyoxylase-like metal-dependent hydrolase (beta-lactamase superfamily II)
MHEIYAIQFARFVGRRRTDNFLGGDPSTESMPIAYFFFLVRGPAGDFVIDTGFDAAAAAKRKREFLICPGAALQRLGLPPGNVQTVVLTHLHYDHCGNQSLFPNARFHLQWPEMAYATGPAMRHRALSNGYEPDDLAETLRRFYEGRLVYHDGEAKLAPGITLHRVGGHTDGQMVLRVQTRKGWMVLASDAVAYFENFARRVPFPALYHVGDALDAMERVSELADADDLVIPGHDPALMERYPAASGETQGIVVRLD